MATTDQIASEAKSTSGFGRRLARFLGEQGFLVIFLAWILFLTFATDAFATSSNAFTVLRQAAIVGIMAIAAHFIILLGDIDLSIAAVMSLGGVLMGGLMVRNGLNPWLAASVALGVGALIGIVNGLIITQLGINAIIATLGMASILEGLAFTYTGGKTIFGDQIDVVEFLARAHLLDVIPLPVIILLVLYILAFLMLRYTTFGAYLFAVGNNAKATWLAGINDKQVKIVAFVMAGLLGSFAGIMQVARQGTATAGMGLDFLFPVLTAVILGGASLQGGRGKIFNTLLAAIFLTTINNGMILLGVSIYAQRIVSGAILILALSLDRLRSLRV
ncbi:MAG: ABC transporter permease [Candidatus Promineifilaceae bacterium]